MKPLFGPLEEKKNATYKSSTFTTVNQLSDLGLTRSSFQSAFLALGAFVRSLVLSNHRLLNWTPPPRLDAEAYSPNVDSVNDVYYGLDFDTSADMATIEQLAVHVRSVDGHGEPISNFLGILPLKDGKAETIFQGVLECARRSSLRLHRLITSTTDGCRYSPNNPPLLVIQFLLL